MTLQHDRIRWLENCDRKTIRNLEDFRVELSDCLTVCSGFWAISETFGGFRITADSVKRGFRVSH